VDRGAARPRRPVARLPGRANGARVTAAATVRPAAPALPRGAILLLGMAGAVVTIGGIRAVNDFLAPIFLALMLVITVSPLTGWLRSLGTPAWLAALATVTTVYVLLLALIGAVVVSLARLVDLLPTYRDELAGLRADATRGLGTVGVDAQPIHDIVDRIEPGTLVDLASGVFGGMLGFLSDLFFLVAVLLFLCFDAVFFPARLAAAGRDRPLVVAALRSFAQGTRRYLLVTTVFGLIVALVDTGALWALGIPLPLLWGLLSFITNYIPNVGFVIGLVPPALLGLLEGGTNLMLAVVAVYCAVNFVIQSIIQPKVVGDAVGLSTTVSFLSVIFWGWVLGPLGALLAIPMSLLAKGLLVDIDPATRWMEPIISSGSSTGSSGGGRAAART
jgi:AI-2 transport protein TqsA